MHQECGGIPHVIQETAPDGDITPATVMIIHTVTYPAQRTIATGSRKTMTWSRYGQLLSFTDCSGYVTRYDHDRFGQMTAVRREEGLGRFTAHTTAVDSSLP